MLLSEEWKEIKDYENYEISNFGDVRNKKTQRILKPWKCTSGYLEVYLWNNGKSEVKLIHRLVALAFLTNPTNLSQVNHKDEDKTNNAVDNLEWCDSKYNANYGTRNKRSSERRSLPILQLDLQGNFIKEFPSIRQAIRDTGVNNIAFVLSGRYNQAGGYLWKYKD